MKKIIRLFASVGLTLSITSNLVACGNKPEIKQEIYVPQLLPAGFEWSLNTNGPINIKSIFAQMQEYLVKTNYGNDYQLVTFENIRDAKPRHIEDKLVLLEFTNISSPFYVEYYVTGYKAKDNFNFNIDNSKPIRQSSISIRWGLENIDLDQLVNLTIDNNTNFSNIDYQNYVWNQLAEIFIKNYYQIGTNSLNLNKFCKDYKILFVDDKNNLFYNNDFNNSLKYTDYGTKLKILSISSIVDEPRLENYINLSLKKDLLFEHRFDVSNLQDDITFPDIIISNWSEANEAQYGKLMQQIEIYKQISLMVGIDFTAESYNKFIYFSDGSELITNLVKYYTNMENTSKEIKMIIDFDEADIDHLTKGQIYTNILLSK